MPETETTPNFEQMAREIAKLHAGRSDEDGDGNMVDIAANEDELTADVAQQLRSVWNARGAADIAKIERELGSMMGAAGRPDLGGSYAKIFDRALRTLDR